MITRTVHRLDQASAREHQSVQSERWNDNALVHRAQIASLISQLSSRECQTSRLRCISRVSVRERFKMRVCVLHPSYEQSDSELKELDPDATPQVRSHFDHEDLDVLRDVQQFSRHAHTLLTCRYTILVEITIGHMRTSTRPVHLVR